MDPTFLALMRAADLKEAPGPNLIRPCNDFVGAGEALRLAEAEPDRAVALSARVAARARSENDLATAAVAERAWGRALRHRGDVDSAIGHLREAVRLGRRARSPRLAAEARMTLSLALLEGGRPQQALAEI